MDRPRPAAGQDGASGRRARLAEWMTPTTAIVCIGNELRGDDGAGPAVARQLAGAVPWDVHDTRTAPENFLMKIVRARPASVVVVDAVHFGAAPGSVGWFTPEDLPGSGPGTHGPGPAAFLDLLRTMHPCPCAILGVQPGRLHTGADLSAPVRRAVEEIVNDFRLLASSRAGR